MWEQWYARGQDVAPRLEERAEMAAERADDRAHQARQEPAPAQPERRDPQRRYWVSTE